MSNKKIICCECGKSNYKEDGLIEVEQKKIPIYKCSNCENRGLINKVLPNKKMAFYKSSKKQDKKENKRIENRGRRVKKLYEIELERLKQLNKSELRPYDYEEVLEERQNTKIRVEMLYELVYGERMPFKLKKELDIY